MYDKKVLESQTILLVKTNFESRGLPFDPAMSWPFGIQQLHATYNIK